MEQEYEVYLCLGVGANNSLEAVKQFIGEMLLDPHTYLYHVKNTKTGKVELINPSEEE